MKARITNIAVSNDGEKTTIISNDDNLSKGQELACRLLSSQSFGDLDEIEEEAREYGVDSMVDLVESIREKLNDEALMAKMGKDSRKGPCSGGGYSIRIKARSEDEEYNQDINIRVAGRAQEDDWG